MSFKIKRRNKNKKYVKTGPTKEGLLQSREIRQRFLDKFGYVPDSILVADRSEKALDFFTRDMGGAYVAGAKKKAEMIKNRDIGSDTISSMTVYRDSKSSKYYRGKGLEEKDRIFLSLFPQNVGRILVDIYCPENGVVYDPFAGHNSRMELVYKSGRDYIGVDISKQFMEANKKARKYLYNKRKKSLLKKSKNKIRLIRGSSARVKSLGDCIADMTITSPPYWDIEYYGSEKQQLGMAKTYEEFMERLRPHIEENYRILKNGAFCIWVVNDFRRGKFYPFHIDLYNIFIESGFEGFHIYIMDYGSGFTSMFVQDIVNKRMLGKRHEYIMIFKKEEQSGD